MYKSKYREVRRNMWAGFQAPSAISFLVLRIVLIIGSASDWLRQYEKWNMSCRVSSFYIVFVSGLNWDLSELRSSLVWALSSDLRAEQRVTKWQSMKEKNFTWQTLIVTKAANCADTEKMPREKQRKLVVRALARICVWVLEHWNIIERCWEHRSGRMGHHDSPRGTKHFH